MLIISTIWSLKSCFILQLKSMVVEKCYFSTTSKMIAVLWALFATCRRVLTIITFFTPCMGLFSASYHYHFEQIPYSARIQYAKVQNITTEDRIYLHGLEKDVKWTEIDRWTYKGSTPTPPGYELYTGFNLKEYFGLFFLVTFLQLIVLLLVKIRTAHGFYNRKDIFGKMVHLFENLNYASPYQDWDVGSGTQEEFKERYSLVKWEMMWTFMTNFFFSIILIMPMIYTGSQIISRHQTLARISTTREEEDESYQNTIMLMIASSCGLLVFGALEMGFYYLFNYKFHPWKGLVQDNQEAFVENLNNLKGIQKTEEEDDSCCKKCC